MHPSFKSITRALLCTALFSSLVHAAPAAEDATADAKTKIAEAIAKPIIKKIKDDAETAKDREKIEKAIKEGFEASEFASVPAIQELVRTQVWTAVGPKYGEELAKEAQAAAAPPVGPKSNQAKDNDLLKQFNTHYSSKAVLATVQIFNGSVVLDDSPALNKSPFFMPRAMGLDISASLPAGSSSLRDYANSQLLLRDGGFLNIYFSFLPGERVTSKKVTTERKKANHAVYFAPLMHPSKGSGDKSKSATPDKPSPPESAHSESSNAEPGNFYFVNGIGMKAIKTSLDTDNVALTGLGTAFIGLGVSGQIRAENSTDNTGAMRVETTYNYSATSKHAVKALYGAGNPSFVPTTSFTSWSASARIYVHDKFFLNVSYSKPIDRDARRMIHEVVSYSLGYNMVGSDEDKKK